MGPPPFQGGDVPLSENILKKDVDFVKTWVEWAADTRERITRSATSNEDMFVVPEKNTLFITVAWITVAASGTTGNNVRCEISIDGNTRTLITCRIKDNSLVGVAPPMSNSISQSYPMPIKIEAGEAVRYTQTASSSANSKGGFTGFLVPKRLN